MQLDNPMKNFLNIIVYISILLTLLSGCSEDPGILGAGQIATTDMLSVATLNVNSVADTTFVYRYSGTPHMFVGRYSSAGTDIEADGLLQFSGLTSIPDTAIIDSAYVTVYLNYSYTDTIGDVRFGIYEMNVGWNQSTFSWDSLNNSYNPTVKYIFQQSFTGLNNINLPVDSLIEKWVKNKDDKPNGILLKPGLDGSDIIIGTRINSSADQVAKLTVAFHVKGDTIKHFSTYAHQSTFVSNGTFPSHDTTISIQGGVGCRGKLQFDLSSLPKRISITKAILQLTGDTTDELSKFHSHDSLLVHLIRKSVYPYDSTALGTLCTPSIKDGQKIYTADIRAMVQIWLVREPNYGILIRPYSESYSFDHFSIFNNKTVSNLRPKLSIIYSILP
jgi:hypothetical protein